MVSTHPQVSLGILEGDYPGHPDFNLAPLPQVIPISHMVRTAILDEWRNTYCRLWMLQLPASMVLCNDVWADPVSVAISHGFSGNDLLVVFRLWKVLMAPRIRTVSLPLVTPVEVSPSLAAAKPEITENNNQTEVSNCLPR